MKTLVVYDSYFGNTAVIAETIAKELECEHIKVHAFNMDILDSYDNIIVGCPTRAFRPTKEIVSFIKKLDNGFKNIAVFDTRVPMTDEVPKFLRIMANKFGYANDTMEKILVKKRVNLAQKSGAFFVSGNEGPLLDDEIDKAKEWANSFKDMIQ